MTAGLLTALFVVVDCIDDKSLNGREVMCCDLGFSFHQGRQLWEARFSIFGELRSVLLSPQEIIPLSQYEDYLCSLRNY